MSWSFISDNIGEWTPDTPFPIGYLVYAGYNASAPTGVIIGGNYMDIETIAEKLYDEVHMVLRVKLAGVSSTTVVKYRNNTKSSTTDSFRALAGELPKLLAAKDPAELKSIIVSIVPWLGLPRFNDVWWQEYFALLPTVFTDLSTTAETLKERIEELHSKTYILKSSKRKFRLITKSTDRVEFKFLGEDVVHDMSLNDFNNEAKEI